MSKYAETPEETIARLARECDMRRECHLAACQRVDDVTKERDELRKALELEKAEHLATCERLWKIAEGRLKAIARARKHLRVVLGDGASADAAYRALDWRQR